MGSDAASDEAEDEPTPAGADGAEADDDPPTPPGDDAEQGEETLSLEAAQERIDALEADVEALEDQLAEAEDENDRLTDTLARVQADYENYKKRARREKQEAARDARIEMIGVLVDVKDNVERALDADPGPDVEKGLELVLRKIDAELDNVGVERLAPEPGDPFDPSLHEAVMTEPSEEHAPETVIERLQVGYQLEGRQIRPAMVKVATAPDEDGSA